MPSSSLIFDLIMKMGESLHRCGAAANHIESALEALSKHLLDSANFFVTPTSIIGDMTSKEQRQVTRLVRVRPQAIDLKRLQDIDMIGDRLIQSSISIEDAILELKSLDSKPNRKLSSGLKLICFASGAFSFAATLHATAFEALLSSFFAIIVWLWLLWCEKRPRLNELAEPIAGFMIASLASISLGLAALQKELLIISSLIVLIPGLSITVALSELSTRNLLAGTARLTGALTELLKLSFAVVLASKLFASVKLPIVALNLGAWGLDMSSYLPRPLLIALSAFSLTGIFNAKWKDSYWICLGALLAYYATSWGSNQLGASLGIFLGGIFLRSYSNLFARISKKPALTTLLPGLITMVPGSFGFKSSNMLFLLEVNATLSNALQLIVLAVALVAGLSFGQMLISSKRSL